MNKIHIQVEKLFVIIALIVGGILIYLIPPMAAPDENSHFINAYAFSEFNFFPETQGDRLGRVVPDSVSEFVDKYNAKFAQNLNEKYNYQEAYEECEKSTDYTQRHFKEYWNADVNLVAYISSGTGMLIYRSLAKVFRFIGNSNYNLLMVGRISNLLFYILIMYFALKWTPVLKNTMFIISLLPMSIYLASSLSYDVDIIGISCLLFSRVMNIIVRENEINKKDLLIIGVCSFFLVNVKQAYAPLLLVLLSISMKKFINKKRYVKYVGIVVGVGIIPYALFKLIYKFGLSNFEWIYSTVMKEQTKILLNNPIYFCKNIWNSIELKKDFYSRGFVGILGQLDTNIPLIYCYLIMLGLLFVAILEICSEGRIGIKVKSFSVIGVCGSIYLIFAGTYIIWTGVCYKVGLDYVEGVQGRYFIPLFLWCIILFCNQKLEKYAKRINLINIAIGVALLSSISTVMISFIRYWI